MASFLHDRGRANFAFVLGGSLLWWMILGCRNPSAEPPPAIVRFRAPAGFRGGFCLIAHSVRGVPIFPKTENGVRVWEIEVPSSGVLLVRNFDFNHEWHNNEVVFDDGVRTPFKQDDGEWIAIENVGSLSSLCEECKYTGYVIGTREETELGFGHPSFRRSKDPKTGRFLALEGVDCGCIGENKP